MNITGIIPARYASTRFPGKPLADIGGKPMIQRVYEQALKSKSLSDVIVATDDTRIEKVVKGFGGQVCMTSAKHPSGTDRCAEVLKKLKLKTEAIINIQGDEPFINPKQIDLLAGCFADERTDMATLIKPVKTQKDLFNPNLPKVIFDKSLFAIYFSRNTIPFLRGKEKKDWLKHHLYYKHLGIYGYRPEVLKKITSLKPSLLELAESLEQLRWIENGFSIKVAITQLESIAIDTPDDLKKVMKSI